MKKFYTLLVGLLLIVTQLFSQTVSKGYTVAAWEGFRTSAATFTFDDGCANQLSLAVPVFDKYGYKASFFLVTSWSPNWSTYSNLVTKGHEVGSHSVNHGDPMPDGEISSSKQIINTNIANQDCNTITYPNCKVPSETELAKYYIGGRICDGNVNPKSPSNYYRIGSIICGNAGSCNTTDNFKTHLNTAINTQGWAVFLIHEVESGNGYSPTATSAIEGALQYAHDNDSKLWVTTFRNAIMYAKERDNLSLVETAVSNTKLSLAASTSLSNTVATYNYPITVRREMPTGWTNMAVSTDSKDITVTIETINNVKYAQFSVVPGKTYSLEDRVSSATGEGGTTTESTTIDLIGNGEFDNGVDGWQTQVGGDAKCNFTATTSAGLSGYNAAQLCPNGNYGTENWHIQAFQNVALEEGVTYTLSFSAKATAARKLYVMVQKIAADYDTYLYKEIDLTTTKQDFQETFTAPSGVAAESKVTFCIGGADGCVYLDKISFTYEKSSTSGDDPGNDPGNDVEVTGDISQYFIDKAYIGPSCDGTPNSRGAYYTGEYPNLFTQYLGKTQAEVDAKINSVWNHFFSGTNTVYYEVGSDMAYIYDTGNGDVRTEGMSYGMMICVQLGKQEQFDKLWRWAKKYMQYKSGDSREGLFAWQCETNGTIKGASCAPDGEAYFLTALFFASHRWGNTGSIDYGAEAQFLIKEILDKSGRGNGSVSPIFNMSNYLITFGETSYDFSDPSYNLPGFFELWARWTNTNKSFWAETPTAARNLLYKSANATTGLYPDYCTFEGAPHKPSWCTYESDYYKYDAIRCPMNVGMDYNWFAADNRQQTMIKNILTFFKNDGYQHGYFTVSGGNASGGYSEGMAGANGVGVFALASGNDALAKEYVQRLWNTTPPSGQWRYYNGMVYFLSMLHASGDFKIFKPTPEVVVESLQGPAPVEFNGQSFTKDTTFKALLECKIYDVTITIEEASSHSVIFKDYDGTTLSTVEVNDGENATAPAEPSRTGYTFTGWDKSFTNVTSDLTITAIYDINTYAVIFVDYDGTELDVQNVEYGSDATAPAEPSRTGYTFSGWDKTFTNITAALTVTAQYTENPPVTPNKYEAENATLSGGATVATDALASGGKYAQMQGGNITFSNVTADKTGVYTLTIHYKVGQYKQNDVEVNGTKVGTVTFEEGASGYADISSTITLQSGNNTVAIVKNWGWSDVDYITVSPYESVPFSLSNSLVTENPTEAAIELYQFLLDNFGTKTISGTMTENLENSDGSSITAQSDFQKVYTKSGKYPALGGFDFMRAVGKDVNTNPWYHQYMNKSISLAEDLWEQGGIPAFCWHWQDPSKTTGEFYTQKGNSSNYTTFDFRKAFVNGTTNWNTSSNEYKYLTDDIDTVAKYFLAMQAKGMAAIFRPLHEVGGDWFWWTNANGTTVTGAEYAALYRLIYDRMVTENGVRNLIWVFNPSNAEGTQWNPGDDYYDILSVDIYNETNNHSSNMPAFNTLKENFGAKKMQSLSECGPIPDVNNMELEDAMWSWWMIWYYTDANPYANYTSNEVWTSNMNDDRVITLDEMPGWSKAVDSYIVTFVDYNGAELRTETVESGKSATAPSEPSRAGYTFAGWDKEFTNVTSNLTVTAQYTEKASAVYTALNAAIAEADALIESEYTVTTWSAMQTELTAAKNIDKNLYVEDQNIVDAVTTALTNAMNALVNVYTVTFVDYNGTQLGAVTVERGNAATAPSEPVRAGYTFAGWDKTFTNVTSNLTVTAQYMPKASAIYTALNAAIADADALIESEYTAASWSAMQTELTAAKNVDKNLYTEDQSIINAATAALNNAMGALVKVYTVTFVDYNGTELRSEKVVSGKSATAPSEPDRAGYTFSGWDKAFTNVTSNLTVTAQYTEKANASYTALNTAIAEANALKEVEYTVSTWSAVQTALTEAKGVDKNLYAEDQNIVDAATTALTNAMNALVNVYTVIFVDEYGAVLKTESVVSGNDATAPSVTIPEGYMFVGWSKEFTNVTSNLTVIAMIKTLADYTALNQAIATAEALIESEYTAATWAVLETELADAKAVKKDLYAEQQYDVNIATVALNYAIDALIKIYTVTFVDYNGTVLNTEKVESGNAATAPSVTARAGYTFTGWDKAFTNVISNLTVTALYVENGKADYNALNIAIAEAEGLAQGDYTATTWSALQTALAAANNVDKNLYAEDQNTVDAATTALTNAMSALVNVYTVTFVNDNGTELKTETVESGKSATAPTVPARAGFTFAGWDKGYTNVTSNLTVTAQYTEKGVASYTALNTAIAEAEALKEAEYTAATWSALQTALTAANNVDKNLYAEDQNIVDAATTALTHAMSALVNVYTVTFVDDNGTVLGTGKVESGSSATAPTVAARAGYTFAGWDKTFTNVTSNLTVTAQYTKKDGASYTALNAAIAEAEGLSQGNYTAATWLALQTALTAAKNVDKNLYVEDQNIVDAATAALTNVMNALVNVYTVTFVDDNGTVLKTEKVESGNSATAPSVATRDGYTFTGWNKAFTSVTSNLTVTAQYVENGKADYNALNAAIAEADALIESDYTATTWSAVETALTAANNVDKNLYAEDQNIVDAATNALITAINALENVDRTILASTISTAETTVAGASEGNKNGQYPVGSKAELNAAIQTAKTVYNKVSVSQSEIDAANSALVAALNAFNASVIVISVDKTDLLLAIGDAHSAIKKADGNTGSESGQYPASAVASLQTAIDNALETYDNATEQAVVDLEAQTLLAAIQVFLQSVNPVIIDYTELAAVVAEASDLLDTTSVGETPGQYPLMGYMDLSREKQDGEAMVRTQTSSTQKEVNDQVALIRELMESYRNSLILAATTVDVNAVSIYTKGFNIVVENAESQEIKVYDITGKIVVIVDGSNMSDYTEIPLMKCGVYIVKSETAIARVVIK